MTTPPQTPPPDPPRPNKVRSWWSTLSEGQGAVIAAVIGLLVTAITLLSSNSPAPAPTLPPPTAAVIVVTSTDTTPPTLTATASPTPLPTASATQTPMPTATTPPPTLAPEQLALTPVTANAAWTPHHATVSGMALVLVPAGCFRMGNDPDAYEGEPDGGPQCFTEPFWIGRYAVTNAQYTACVAAGWCNTARYADNPNFNAPQQPVVGISWADAQAYVAWLRQRTGLACQLPTEAAWEYTARGPDALLYPWGDDFDGTRLNFCDANCAANARDPGEDDGYPYSAPVGSYSPQGDSWVGAADMAGNVWEWTASQWAAYPYDALDGREDAQDTAAERVVRGGSWLNYLYFTHTSHRYHLAPASRYNDQGFRVWCASLTPPAETIVPSAG